MKKKLILSVLLIFLSVQPLFAETLSEPLYSKGLLLMEKDSKRVLYEKNGHEPLAMASTTKIMTCIIALESGKLDEIVTVSSRAAKAPKVKLNLQVGEKQRLKDLLYSLMLESHNDSAVAIAEHVSGSVEDFCKLMTEKAKEIGAVDTQFETPNGLDSANHYSTPYDMALIAAYALNNPEFIKITNTKQIEIPTTSIEGSKRHSLINKNRFLSQYPGAIGMKTGFTSKAGHCFVGAADREDMQLIGVALGAGWNEKGKARKFSDVSKMMNYGYKNYKKYKIVEEGQELATVKIEKGKQPEVQAYCNEEVVLPLTESEKEQVELKKTVPTLLKAPVNKGQVVGKLEVICGDQILRQTDLLAREDVHKATLLDRIKSILKIQNK